MRDDLRHVLVLGIGTGVSSLFRIAYVIYAGRTLGPAGYAEFYAALSIIFLFAAGLAPIGGSITRFSSLFKASGHEGKVLAMRRAMPRRVARWALAFLAVGLALAWPVGHLLRFVSPWTAPLVATMIALNLLVDTPRGFLRGTQSFRAYGLNLAGESVLRLAICVGLFAFVASAPFALLAHIAAATAIYFVGYRQLRGIGGTIEEQSFDEREVTLFMVPLFGFAFVGSLYQNLDTLFVKALFDAVEAGQYGAVSALAKLVGLAFLPFSILALPLLTTAFTKGETVWPPLLRAIAGFSAVTGLILTVYHLFGERILALLYGTEYLGTLEALIPLTLAAALASISILAGQAFAAMNRFSFLRIYAAGIVVEIALIWLARDSIRHLAQAVAVTQFAVVAILLAYLWHTTSNTARESP